MEYDVRDKHRQALREGMGLHEDSNMVNSVAVQLDEMRQEDDEELLEGVKKTRFRSLAATLSHMSLDRSDAQHAAKEICTKMASPTPGSWNRLKKACRFSKGVERVTWVMRAWKRDEETHIDAHVDSDRAQGPERKSTSGGLMMINGTVVKQWSRTQASRGLSTAEAEYYAVITGAAEGLGTNSTTEDLGLKSRVSVWTVSGNRTRKNQTY